MAGASKGVALTTTAAITSLPLGTRYVHLSPRNFASSAVVARFAFNPWLTCLLTSTGTTYLTDVSREAQDGDTTIIDFSSFPTLANGGALYIGSPRPFRGVAVDIGAATQSTVATLLVEYLNASDTWVDLSITDGSASGGAPFAVDGLVTWTVPATTAWTKRSLGNKLGVTTTSKEYGDKLYWTRWTTSAAFDSTTSVLQLRALNRSTAYAELQSGEWFEQLVSVGYGGVGNVEAVTDTGTANLIINVATMGEDFV